MTNAPRHLVIADPDSRERARVTTLVMAISADIGPVQLHEAQDGREALAKIESLGPALVITEVLLEGISGLSLLRRLKRARGRDAPPFIYTTTMARESDRYWGLRNGAHGYLMKPYEDDLLQQRVREVLTGDTSLEKLGSL